MKLRYDENLKLTSNQKDFVVNQLKPFLQRNNMERAREFLMRESHLPLPESMTIRIWLLQNLGEELYFKYSDRVLVDEFGDTIITEIELPGSVWFISFRAFADSDLQNIKLNEGLEVIGEGAFSGTRLEQIDIPQSVEQIHKKAFFNCKSLKKITLSGDSKIVIDQRFWNAPCEIYIPKNKNVVWADTLTNSFKEKIVYY
jgi:hypothetical protein